MKCLCCGKEITKSEDRNSISWHRSCLKQFFGSTTIPQLDIEPDELNRLVDETVNSGFTIPGVQKKMSLCLSTQGRNNRLTLVNYPAGYILKPQSPEYKSLPELEYLVMSMAKISGINTVPFGLFPIGDEYAYITKRVDRDGIIKYAMEDFCQIEGRLTSDKYKGSYENCGRVIKKYAKSIGLDMAELFLRLVFCYCVGNSDMHLKNFSLLEIEPGKRIYNLSPAYDLLPVNLIIPTDKDEMALTLNGKKRNIRKKDFLALAENYGIDDKVANALIRKVLGYREKYLELVEQMDIEDAMKEKFKMLIRERCGVLE